jgi:hypothetical protein
LVSRPLADLPPWLGVDLGRLIVASGEQAPGVQRNGHDQVGVGDQLGRRPRQPAGEQGAQLRPVGVLELQDQVLGSVVIEAGRPRPVEQVRPRQAGDAAGAEADIVSEGRAAAVAGGLLQKRDALPGSGG